MRKKVLVAPLDWGLGHATRCIPLIKALVEEKLEVVIAAEGKGEQLLRLEFPDLRFLELKGYRVEYGRSRWEMLGKMLWQIPKILECIDEEKEWLASVMAAEHFDVVIADDEDEDEDEDEELEVDELDADEVEVEEVVEVELDDDELVEEDFDAIDDEEEDDDEL